MTTTTAAPHEPSAWLRDTAARRLAQIDALNLDAQGAVIVAPLMGSVTALGEPADRTCDRCSTYVPQGQDYFPGPVVPRVGVVLIMGLCQTCRDLEVGQ